MIKESSSVYETRGTRSNKWIKMKHQSLVSGGIGDSLDLIPIGAYYGKGVRGGGLFGAYLMASYDRRKGAFEATCKVGTGFSKESLKALTEGFKSEVIKGNKPDTYLVPKDKRLQPDVWLLPNQVWEIAADTISKSPTYLLARDYMSDQGLEGGLSLRFPRFIR